MPEPPNQMVGRVCYAGVEGAAGVFTPAFCEYLVALVDLLGDRVHALRAARRVVLDRAHYEHVLPGFPDPAAIGGDSWLVPPVPTDLLEPGIEISGPCSVTRMFINALNPGPEGERAEGDLDDDEDSSAYRLEDTVRAALNRVAATRRELRFNDPERGREYSLAAGELPFFMHRERGLGVDEPDVTVDGRPVSAAILGTALTLFHAGAAQAERGDGIYFYLPKMEAATEARWYRDLFDESRACLPHLRAATIRAIPLIESLPAVYQMDEFLRELGPYAAGLNAARWDLKASIFEFVMTDPSAVWPDRFGVDVKTTPFLADIFRRLVAICLQRGAVPIGGMAVALPSNDPEVNRIAGEAIRKDKEWEAEQGFRRAWVAHIFHMKAAADPFRARFAGGWSPPPEMADPGNYPIRIEVPAGPITLDGTRRNVRMIIEYLEGWLDGRGAKGIDSLAGKPGLHPALMEDLATGRMSVAQVAQRIRHRTPTTEGPATTHDEALVKALFEAELADILRIAPDASPALEDRYAQAMKVGLRWVKNYTELDFRSLGSYTRGDLTAIAAAPDAF